MKCVPCARPMDSNGDGTQSCRECGASVFMRDAGYVPITDVPERLPVMEKLPVWERPPFAPLAGESSESTVVFPPPKQVNPKYAEGQRRRHERERAEGISRKKDKPPRCRHVPHCDESAGDWVARCAARSASRSTKRKGRAAAERDLAFQGANQ